MCESGINTGQMTLAVAMVNDALGLAQQHLEQLHHVADHAGRSAASAELAQVTVLLGEARDKLDTAVEQLEGGHTDHGVTVERL